MAGRCRHEVLSPLACSCWPEGKSTRIPPLFIASNVMCKREQSGGLADGRCLVLKIKTQKEAPDLFPKKNASRGKWEFRGGVQCIRHRGKLFLKNMLRMESMDFEAAGN